MTHHSTTTRGERLGLGAAFCIKATTLEVGDVLDIVPAGGMSLEARIEFFDQGRLRIQAGDQRYICRPWQIGDLRLPQEHGTTSCWTIQQLAQPEMA